MNCVEKKCKGELGQGMYMRSGCHSYETLFPCSRCGRLHRLVGDEAHKTPSGVFTRDDKRAFLIEGKLVNK
jgi:hypothetical protein